MWKPGTRVVKVRGYKGPVGPRPIRVPIGSLATVTGGPISPANAAAGADIEVVVDGIGRRIDERSFCWEPLATNDSTGITSVEQLKRSLAKPQAVPCE